MMKKMGFVGLSIVIVCTALWYGYMMGSTQRFTSYIEDQRSCINICEPNGGLERIRTSVYCGCANGALFTEDDIRNDK